MEGDLKEVVGTLMRVLDGDTLSRAEVEDLAFEADGELRRALNDAYIQLLQFAHDCEAEIEPGDQMRVALQSALDEIVRCSDPTPASASDD